ncbi:HigA family addiction module antitoxin [Asticcacaulis sp. DXS10W]|uniref:HigA family addiction module antitoxin n=1 Tax=Asticcacaulis currens TaxID=2984210 RepID=A0ABT5IDJ5_9CAUL|nr:HigA family addiction module antitoxin [Asticcacaulis currens]MDC7694251.1 HigA family addiction module antitoxin [Asticcacaulis currens]
MERDSAPPIAIAIPGEILLEEFLKPMNIAVEALADQIGHDQCLIDGFIKGQHRLEPDVLISIDRALGLSDGYWSNVQAQHDNHMAKTRSE